MIPASFEYLAPQALPEAIALLQQHGADAKILAGGHSLIPLMKLRLAAPAYLIDINRIAGLAEIGEGGGYLRIGAMVREADLESSDLVRSLYPILVDASNVIADPLVRNLATVGGNLAHADPANDHPAVMLALNAVIGAEGPDGKRQIPIEQFFVDTFETSLGPAELLTEILIPLPPPHSGGVYRKLERKVGDYAIVGVAVQLSLADAGTIASAGIGLTNVGATAIKATTAEMVLVGQMPTEDVLKEAAAQVASAAEPTSDLRGPADYKREMIRVLTGRALAQALERARGGA